MAIRLILVCVLAAVAAWSGCRPEGADQPASLRLQFIELAEARTEKRDASAHVYLGWTYLTGSGVVKNRDHALNHLEAAAKLADPLSARLLKVCEEGSAEETDKLVAEIRRGAAAGEMNAQMILATWLVFGEGLAKNPREARRLLEISAQQGNTFARHAMELLDEWMRE